MEPAGEMWSVVTESPKTPRARAPVSSAIAPGLHGEAGEERRLLDVGRLRVEGVGVAGRRRDLVPLRILRGEIGVEPAEDLGLEGRLHQVPDLGERGPDVARGRRRGRRGPCPSGSWSMSMSTRPASANATTSGGDMRKLALMLWWTRASKLRLPGKDGGRDEVVLRDRVLDRRRQRAGVADAGRAAVADGLEAQGVEVGLEARAGQVVGDDPRAGRERRLDGGADAEPPLHRLLRQEARGQHDGGVGGVGAARDGGDQHAAVPEPGRAVAVQLATSTDADSKSSAFLPNPLSATGLENEPTNSRFRFGSSILSCGRLGPATLGTTEPRSSSMSCE